MKDKETKVITLPATAEIGMTIEISGGPFIIETAESTCIQRNVTASKVTYSYLPDKEDPSWNEA